MVAVDRDPEQPVQPEGPREEGSVEARECPRTPTDAEQTQQGPIPTPPSDAPSNNLEMKKLMSRHANNDIRDNGILGVGTG